MCVCVCLCVCVVVLFLRGWMSTSSSLALIDPDSYLEGHGGASSHSSLSPVGMSFGSNFVAGLQAHPLHVEGTTSSRRRGGLAQGSGSTAGPSAAGKKPRVGRKGSSRKAKGGGGRGGRSKGKRPSQTLCAQVLQLIDEFAFMVMALLLRENTQELMSDEGQDEDSGDENEAGGTMGSLNHGLDDSCSESWWESWWESPVQYVTCNAIFEGVLGERVRQSFGQACESAGVNYGGAFIIEHAPGNDDGREGGPRGFISVVGALTGSGAKGEIMAKFQTALQSLLPPLREGPEGREGVLPFSQRSEAQIADAINQVVSRWEMRFDQPETITQFDRVFPDGHSGFYYMLPTVCVYPAMESLEVQNSHSPYNNIISAMRADWVATYAAFTQTPSHQRSSGGRKRGRKDSDLEGGRGVARAKNLVGSSASSRLRLGSAGSGAGQQDCCSSLRSQLELARLQIAKLTKEKAQVKEAYDTMIKAKDEMIKTHEDEYQAVLDTVQKMQGLN